MPAADGESVITTRGLTKLYRGLIALNGVDLDIPKGPVGLLGPNGAGKSTLIKCLLGLIIPSSGGSVILGHSSNKPGEIREVRSRVGYVPENECLIPDLDGITYVRYMGEISGLPPMDAMQRAHEVLHYVGIGDERYRKIETYSTGMKQKVKLAQALVHDPDLIILDEPTNGMDPKGRQEMLDLIKDIACSHRKNILLSSHLLPDVEFICDHVIILNFGNVLVQGKINDLVRPSDQYEIRIRGDEEQFRKVLDAMGLKWEKKGTFFHVLSGDDIIKDLYRAVSGKDIQIRHATRHRQTLEDIFVMNITGGQS
ncbi:MAG: ABC transporter ATP-binding protein [Candidatus Thermoplasmatota archaeon]|nr:ABC transporter ATP-binding protein [Candidatus Thermoplasmatota archaeon]